MTSTTPQTPRSHSTHQSQVIFNFVERGYGMTREVPASVVSYHVLRMLVFDDYALVSSVEVYRDFRTHQWQEREVRCWRPTPARALHLARRLGGLPWAND